MKEQEEEGSRSKGVTRRVGKGIIDVEIEKRGRLCCVY